MKNLYIAKKDGVIRFDLVKINRDAEKLCKCKIPHFELDSANQMVKCIDCGAIIHPFEALEKFADLIGDYEEYQRCALRTIEELKQEAERQHRRRLKLGVFKDMEHGYLNEDLLPCCPHCGKAFDPIDIDKRRGRKYCDWEVKKGGDTNGTENN